MSENADERAPVVGQGQRPSKNREFLRQSSLTGVAAAGAIVSGLLLDVSIASRYGAGATSDAFFIASRIPLGLVAVVMAGANQALVPAFTKQFARNRGHGFRLVAGVLGWALGIGAVLVVLGALVAVPLIQLTAPGVGPIEAAQAASATRIVFLVVPLVAAAEVLRAFLNARSAFIAPAAMNVVMNGVAAGLIVFGPGRGVSSIAWAYVAGASAQLLYMSVVAARRGLRPAVSGMWNVETAAVGRLTVRPLVGASLNPLVRVVEQIAVSYLPTGSITVLNYGYRLISAIGGSVFFRSVIVTLVPRMTRAAAHEDQTEFNDTVRLGTRVMLALSIPLSAFMAVLAAPTIVVLFHRGNFSRADTTLLGLVLGVYSLSLVGSAVQRALLAPFFARLDTKTPLRNTIYGTVANIVLIPIAYLFSDSHAVLGIALAYGLAQYVNVAHAWYRLHRTSTVRFDGLWSFAGRLVLASGAGAAVMLACRVTLLSGHQDRISLFARLVLVFAIGAATISLLLPRALLGELRRVRRPRGRQGRGTQGSAG